MFPVFRETPSTRPISQDAGEKLPFHVSRRLLRAQPSAHGETKMPREHGALVVSDNLFIAWPEPLQRMRQAVALVAEPVALRLVSGACCPWTAGVAVALALALAAHIGTAPSRDTCSNADGFPVSSRSQNSAANGYPSPSWNFPSAKSFSHPPLRHHRHPRMTAPRSHHPMDDRPISRNCHFACRAPGHPIHPARLAERPPRHCQTA